jgi:hypothetical protein
MANLNQEWDEAVPLTNMEEEWDSATPLQSEWDAATAETPKTLLEVYRERGKNRPSYLSDLAEGSRQIVEGMVPEVSSSSPAAIANTALGPLGPQAIKRLPGSLKVAGAIGKGISTTLGESLLDMQEARVAGKKGLDVTAAGLRGVWEGVTGQGKNTLTEAMEARGMVSPVAFLLDMGITGALDPVSRIGGPAASGLEKAGVAGYKGTKGFTMTAIARRAPEKVKHLTETGFRGATPEFFAKGAKNMAQEFANTIDNHIREYIYKPAHDLWETLKDRAAPVIVPEERVAPIVDELGAIAARDTSKGVDSLSSLVQRELRGKVSGEADTIGKMLLDSRGRPLRENVLGLTDLLRLHRALRAKAKYDPLASQMAEALGNHISQLDETFAPAQAAWKRYIQTQTAADLLYKGSSELRDPDTGKLIARETHGIEDFLKNPAGGEKVAAAETIAKNLEEATKKRASAVQTAQAVSPRAKALRKRPGELTSQQKQIANQQASLPAPEVPKLPSPPPETLPTTTIRRPESMGVPPGRAPVPNGPIDAVAEGVTEVAGAGVPAVRQAVQPGVVSQTPQLSRAEILNKIKAISSVSGFEPATPSLSGLTWAGGAATVASPVVGNAPLGAAGAWLIKEGIPRFNLRSAANTARRYQAVKSFLATPKGKAMEKVAGSVFGEMLINTTRSSTLSNE